MNLTEASSYCHVLRFTRMLFISEKMNLKMIPLALMQKSHSLSVMKRKRSRDSKGSRGEQVTAGRPDVKPTQSTVNRTHERTHTVQTREEHLETPSTAASSPCRVPAWRPQRGQQPGSGPEGSVWGGRSHGGGRNPSRHVNEPGRRDLEVLFSTSDSMW